MPIEGNNAMAKGHFPSVKDHQAARIAADILRFPSRSATDLCKKLADPGMG